MASREEAPKVNAGSMADIAFLLLIFFLVTTTIETDSGLDRMLPRKDSKIPLSDVYQRNILPILLNSRDELMVDGEIIEIENLRGITIGFLDNGGAPMESENYCDYCKGERNVKSSDNPDKAVISLMSNRETTYGVYITVQNELVAAYNTLRNREAQRLYKTDFTTMETLYASSETPRSVKNELKAKIKSIQKLYPMRLSEAERQ